MATEDYRLTMVREKLLKDNIKLWLSPYSNEDGSLGTHPEELIDRYHNEFGFPKEVIISLLEQLRKHSVDNLSARKRYRETGLATIKVKLACGKRKDINLDNSVMIDVPLSIDGQQLKTEIANRIGMRAVNLKLIATGRVIKENESLLQQNVKPFTQVMALLVDDPEQIVEQDNQAASVKRAREDAELLSLLSSVDAAVGREDEQYFQLTDQNGRVLNLPPEEKKALSLAMTLNEKGRAALKRKDYANSLIFLLEADREFQQCNSELIKAVDNYALLCLDIAWCYLCLNNVNQFPDAVSRLGKCETCFHKSYGTNLERLVALKGTTGNEVALFARLHLLQGIVAYHRNEKDVARSLFNRTAVELADLKVNDDQLSQVVALGYSPAEARVALRGCKGNVEQAVQYIIRRNEEKAEIRRKEREERKKQKRQKQLGKTLNGEWLNMDTYDQMCSMGYQSDQVEVALKNANNDLSLAIDLIQSKPEMLNFSDPVNVSEEQIAQLASLGYDVEEARDALEKFPDVKTAVGHLFNNLLVPGTSGQSSITQNVQDQAMAAVDRLREDISEYDEDYLDFTLEEEENFLQEYTALLESKGNDN